MWLRQNASLLFIPSPCKFSLGPPFSPRVGRSRQSRGAPQRARGFAVPGKGVRGDQAQKNYRHWISFPTYHRNRNTGTGTRPTDKPLGIGFSSRKIRVRFGRAIKNVCRWCFSDIATAEAFKEQFGGKYVVKNGKTTAKRTMPNMIAAAFISDSIAYLMSSGAELAAQFGLI
jgi:hypothetical protein